MSKATADALAAMQAITARILRETAQELEKQEALSDSLQSILHPENCPCAACFARKMFAAYPRRK